MRKVFLLISCLFFSITLSSCMNIRIVKIDDITWKSDLFNIVTTSNQLQVYYNVKEYTEGDKYYSDIVIDDEIHSCTVGLENNMFYIILFDETDDIEKSYYDECYEFLDGKYHNLIKVKNQEYIYMLEIDLIKSGQYYEYCIENDIEFPTKLTLYGYKDRK